MVRATSTSARMAGGRRAWTSGSSSTPMGASTGYASPSTERRAERSSIRWTSFAPIYVSGLATVARQPVLSEWLDYWLEHTIKPNREPTTCELYEVLVRLHIRPHLGNVRLDRLHTETIEHWLADLERSGVGLRTPQSALLLYADPSLLAKLQLNAMAPVDGYRLDRGVLLRASRGPSCVDAGREPGWCFCSLPKPVVGKQARESASSKRVYRTALR